VSGEGRGIGAAICPSLAAAGRRVAVADISVERAPIRVL
jgi:NAD(P)-dependent dehydrogenase (short-subunit alcohol dehydrogenase family)